MRTRLRLFLEWGITFGEPYTLPEKAARPVAYASRQELECAILSRHRAQTTAAEVPLTTLPAQGGTNGWSQQEPQRNPDLRTDMEGA